MHSQMNNSDGIYHQIDYPEWVLMKIPGPRCIFISTESSTKSGFGHSVRFQYAQYTLLSFFIWSLLHLKCVLLVLLSLLSLLLFWRRLRQRLDFHLLRWSRGIWTWVWIELWSGQPVSVSLHEPRRSIQHGNTYSVKSSVSAFLFLFNSFCAMVSDNSSNLILARARWALRSFARCSSHLSFPACVFQRQSLDPRVNANLSIPNPPWWILLQPPYQDSYLLASLGFPQHWSSGNNAWRAWAL